MTATLKVKWVEALRSGEYQQGRHYFERDERYCCLGVLCVEAGQPPARGLCGNWRACGDVGLSNEHQSALSTMNDNGFSFAEIADWIELRVPADDGSQS